jgi:hypothetical protein
MATLVEPRNTCLDEAIAIRCGIRTERVLRCRHGPCHDDRGGRAAR